MKKTKKVVREAANHSFSKKIKSLEAIRKIISRRPRKKKTVLCHGTFDIVHPGHIRQLIYAKTKGDILIVSVNIDKYASSGQFAPYVPQELRALNVAAFEIVDYVFLNHQPNAIEAIFKLQPDYYVKGFEYALKRSHPETKQEEEALSSYGGEIIFSPGDVVYSSAHLLAASKPNLGIDQLQVLMKAEGIDFKILRRTITRFKQAKIHVVGDLIVDKYSRCTTLGPSQKSPAFSVRHDGTQAFVGGAGVVAKHLKCLGAEVILTTVVGQDEDAAFALGDLKAAGVKVNALVDHARPTTSKQRFFADGNRLLLQVDKVDSHPISEEILEKLCRIISKNSADAVVCSDFRHGIFNSQTISSVVQAIPAKSLKIADSQVSNRWGNILEFVGFDLITPNERESRFALGDQDTTIRPLAQMLYNRSNCRYLILKLGEKGIMVYRSPGMEIREYFYIDTFAEDLADAIGAGDALLSAASLALVVSKNIVHAAILGNMSAALECARLGNIPVSDKELVEMTHSLERRF
ncbi:adenylyltransferase/cytidyltransferase family protein [Candidatus Daviesbacteria bacterium]|nr:adenylyltransferase/cytidyltransferase family protein [Candidatus Daviesbacteria bacterium]